MNALANYCFLTQSSNLTISATLPEIYFPQIESQYPGSLTSQWIPMDPALWRIENYADFLFARRELLAAAANQFLDGLLSGGAAATNGDINVSTSNVTTSGGIDSMEEAQLQEVNAWLLQLGLPPGETLFELTDSSGNVQEILDLAWPAGLQTGLSEPVALLLEEPTGVLEAASSSGYRCFTTIDELKHYVLTEISAAR